MPFTLYATVPSHGMYSCPGSLLTRSEMSISCGHFAPCRSLASAVSSNFIWTGRGVEPLRETPAVPSCLEHVVEVGGLDARVCLEFVLRCLPPVETRTVRELLQVVQAERDALALVVIGERRDAGTHLRACVQLRRDLVGWDHGG